MEIVETDLTIIEGLKKVRPLITPQDVTRAATLANKHSVTITAYLKGEVGNLELGERLLNFFNACADINEDCRKRKEDIVF